MKFKTILGAAVVILAAQSTGAFAERFEIPANGLWQVPGQGTGNGTLICPRVCQQNSLRWDGFTLYGDKNICGCRHANEIEPDFLAKQKAFLEGKLDAADM